MEVIRHDKNTGETIKTKYPRIDLEPVVGLAENIEYYELIYENIEHNIFQILKPDDVILTSDKGTFLNIARQTYVIEQKSNDDIINILNSSVGSHIDNLYPLWEQNKHSGQIMRLVIGKEKTDWDEFDFARYNWIVDTANWAKTCREMRDEKELILKTKGIMPNLNDWPERPQKPEILTQ